MYAFGLLEGSIFVSTKKLRRQNLGVYACALLSNALFVYPKILPRENTTMHQITISVGDGVFRHRKAVCSRWSRSALKGFDTSTSRELRLRNDANCRDRPPGLSANYD